MAETPFVLTAKQRALTRAADRILAQDRARKRKAAWKRKRYFVRGGRGFRPTWLTHSHLWRAHAAVGRTLGQRPRGTTRRLAKGFAMANERAGRAMNNRWYWERSVRSNACSKSANQATGLFFSKVQ